jgi:serine/threonine protein phosphatase 1
MTYVISDIHGNLTLWQKMLSLIRFQETDMMFILGDTIDYGKQSIPLLFDLLERPNVYPILGNHECNMLMCIQKLPIDTTMKNLPQKTSQDVLPHLRLWLKNGGRSTIEQYLVLDCGQKEQIQDYLQDFTAYEEITVQCIRNGVEEGERHFVLTHSGLKNFSPERGLEDYKLDDFLADKPTPESRYFKDKTLIFGRLPSKPAGVDEKIFYGTDFIAIDCGCAFSGKLACLRLDDGKEFYVQ